MRGQGAYSYVGALAVRREVRGQGAYSYVGANEITVLHPSCLFCRELRTHTLKRQKWCRPRLQAFGGSAHPPAHVALHCQPPRTPSH